MTNDTLKEYYIKLNEAWNNAINVLTAINQSLVSNSTNIEVNFSSEDGTTATYKIPSFLYLENKLETLNNNFESLFNIPNSGEAWLTTNGDTATYKLQMVRTGVSPISPILDTKNAIASLSDNNFLKDLVTPKTFLKVGITNLPDNIEKILMKKVIFNDQSYFDAIKKANPETFEDFVTYIYSLRKGVDYEEYESIIDLPLRRDKFKSAFRILYVDNDKTKIDEVTGKGLNKTFTVTLDTLKYTDQDDPSIEFGIAIGDKLCLGNSSVIFTVKSINKSANEIIVEETIGHYNLQNYDEDQNMVFGIYNNDFSDYHYVEIPLEENPFICIMIGTIQNNVRSILSIPYFVNLNEVYMTDENEQYIYDEYGNKETYIQYYERNCKNIGDLILGLTQSAYPQLSNFSSLNINDLRTSPVIKNFINDSIDANEILKVLPINKHVIDNATTEQIISMNSQKNELNSKINSLNDSINTINNKLSSTDFSQEAASSQSSLKAELNNYYSEKNVLQQQMISLVEDINISAASIEGKSLKYRIRGIAKTNDLEDYIHANISEKIDLIGIDVEYKYKSLNKETTTVTSIDNSLFSDWNKFYTIDKERIVKFNANGSYYLDFENYSDTNNIIKWNQIDIPIVADEDVIIRIRYKYNVGQPFVNIYSEWSDEITMVFPDEYKNDIDVNAIITENQNEIIEAKFNKALITEGYAEHINDGLSINEKKYYHHAANIYSGFSTPENNLLSIKDKLDEITLALNKYQSMLESEASQKLKVYLVYDQEEVELLGNTTNKINIYNSEHITNSFIQKKMNLVFKNTGEVPVRMYSIFPGNISTPLIFCNDSFYEKTIVNYERVPLIVGGAQHYQNLGQWIYFRQNNPWTSQNIYYDSPSQDRYDWLANDSEGCVWHSLETYTLMKKNYNQVMFGWRKRETGSDIYYTNNWKGLLYNYATNSFETLENDDYTSEKSNAAERYNGVSETFFMYNNLGNNYLNRYEDIYYDENGSRYYLDVETSLKEFVSMHNVGGNFVDDNSFLGAFLYPDLSSNSILMTDGAVGGYVEIGVGASINVPVTLEFYLNETLTSVTKGLYFDIKPSSYSEPSHYMLDITAFYDYTSSGNVIGNVSLNDESIE